jgi:hypothetical protein
MAEIINLNKARKEREKAADKAKAAENRVAKGQKKVFKSRLQQELEKARRELDGKKLED